MKAAVELAKSEFGGLHVAVNCAGIGNPEKFWTVKATAIRWITSVASLA